MLHAPLLFANLLSRQGPGSGVQGGQRTYARPNCYMDTGVRSTDVHLGPCRDGDMETYCGRDKWRFEGCQMRQTYTPGRAAIPGRMCIWARVGIGPAACALVFMARSNGATYGLAPSGIGNADKVELG